MVQGRTRVLALAAIFAGFPVLAGPTIVVPVAADESVNSGYADRNYSDNLNRGGLFVGADGTGNGVSRFYLKFLLPDRIAPEELARATLSACYFDDLDRRDNGVHRIHFVAADDWQETTITWDNQPGPTFGLPEAIFDASTADVGDTLKWDVTGIVRNEMKGDRIVSFLFAASNESNERENRNWEYFAEREFDPTKSFRLTLATRGSVGGGSGGDPTPVPLPPAVVPGAVTLAAMALPSIRRRFRCRRQATC